MNAKAIWFEARREQYFIDGQPIETSELVGLRNAALRRRETHTSFAGVKLAVDYIQHVLTCVHDSGWFFGVLDGSSGERIDLAASTGDDVSGRQLGLFRQALETLKLASDLRRSGVRGKPSEDLEEEAFRQIEAARKLVTTNVSI